MEVQANAKKNLRALQQVAPLALARKMRQLASPARHGQTISPLEGEMPRQGQRGVNPLRAFGVCGFCPIPPSVAFATSPPQGGRLKGVELHAPCSPLDLPGRLAFAGFLVFRILQLDALRGQFVADTIGLCPVFFADEGEALGDLFVN